LEKLAVAEDLNGHVKVDRDRMEWWQDTMKHYWSRRMDFKICLEVNTFNFITKKLSRLKILVVREKPWFGVFA